MPWLIGVLCVGLIVLIWPHWIGGEYRNEVQRIIWIIPPFRVTFSHSRTRLFFFSKPIYQFSGDKQRRKKILKERQDSTQKNVIRNTDLSKKDNREAIQKNNTSNNDSKKEITKIPQSILHSTKKTSTESKDKENVESTSTSPKSKSPKEYQTIDETEAETELKPEQLLVKETRTLEPPRRKRRESFLKRIRRKITQLWEKAIQLWKRESSFIKKNLKWIRYFLKISWRLIRPTSFHINFSGGFDDPALTGILTGSVNSLWQEYNGLSRNYVYYQPQFIHSEEWKFEGDITVRTSIGAIILWLLLSLITFPYLEVYRFYKRHKDSDSD